MSACHLSAGSRLAGISVRRVHYRVHQRSVDADKFLIVINSPAIPTTLAGRPPPLGNFARLRLPSPAFDKSPSQVDERRGFRRRLQHGRVWDCRRYSGTGRLWKAKALAQGTHHHAAVPYREPPGAHGATASTDQRQRQMPRSRNTSRRRSRDSSQNLRGKLLWRPRPERRSTSLEHVPAMSKHLPAVMAGQAPA